MRKLITNSIMRPVGVMLMLAMLFAFGIGLVNLFPNLSMSRMARNAIDSLTARVITVTSPGPTIVKEIQSLNRLETARQVNHQIVEAKSDSLPLPEFLVKDKLLMTVQTEIIAGVDFSKFSAKDVESGPSGLVLHLPKPEVFSVNIDDKSSKVYSRERGWFVFHPDPDLERQARLKAKSDATSAARQSDVLSLAQENAEKSVRALLGTAGIKKVDFKWDRIGETAGITGQSRG